MRYRKRLINGVFRLSSLLALLLILGLVINFVLMWYAEYRIGNSNGDPKVFIYAEALKKTENGFNMTEEGITNLEKNGFWAILIGSNGKVKWNYKKPQNIPNKYSIADVASFSRWYLNDYPVRVWRYDDGIFVLGVPKDTVWKYNIEIPIMRLEFYPGWILTVLICNFALILVMSIFMTEKWHKKRDEARAEWIAGVSHDIRTPLSMVLGYSSEMENDESLTAEQKQQASLICRKSEEMRDLISNLNLTNRLEYSMEPFSEKKISLAALIREVVTEFLNCDIDGLHPIEVEISPSASNIQIKGDMALLSRMLKNLIGNSIRHNPDGCIINVSLECKGRNLILIIKDNGAGFTKEQLERLQSNKAMEQKGGHGLGLTIVKRIAEAHCAKLSFSNIIDGGSCCMIRFKGFKKIDKTIYQCISS